MINRNKNIPIAIITNSGGETESTKARKLSNILELNDPDYSIKEEEIFLCHSAMKVLKDEYLEKTVLITGIGDIKTIMKEYGFRKFLTVEEYSIIFPQVFSEFLVEDLMYSSFINF